MREQPQYLNYESEGLEFESLRLRQLNLNDLCRFSPIFKRARIYHWTFLGHFSQFESRLNGWLAISNPRVEARTAVLDRRALFLEWQLVRFSPVGSHDWMGYTEVAHFSFSNRRRRTKCQPSRKPFDVLRQILCESWRQNRRKAILSVLSGARRMRTSENCKSSV
jgi:hypothetical protein